MKRRNPNLPRRVSPRDPVPRMDLGLEPWPICEVAGCENEVRPERWDAGYHTCIEDHAQSRMHVNIIEVPKSNPMVVTAGTDIRGLASSHKGNRQVF